MTAQGSKKQSAAQPGQTGVDEAGNSGTRSRSAISVRAQESPGSAITPLTKLVSRIPPAPRIPKVDGVSMFAPTVASEPPPSAGAAASSVTPSAAPRWQQRKSARNADSFQAWGAVVAAVLLGAFIVWATR